MNGRFWTDTKVGIFVIAGLVILGIGVSMVGKLRFGKPKGYLVTAVFPSISGVEEKAPVRIAGVRVGEVEKIYLKDGMAYVEMRLAPEAVLHRDSEVSVASLGLLGEKYVEISAGSKEEPVLESGTVIQGKDQASMDRLIAEFTDIAQDIKKVTASLSAFLGPAQEKSALQELLNNFNAMVEDIGQMVSENREGIRRAVSNFNTLAERADGTLAENREDLRASVRNFRELTEKLKDQVAGLVDNLNRTVEKVGQRVDGAGEDFSAAVAEVKTAAARIADAAGSLQAILEKARAGEGTIGKLLADETAYRNLNDSLANIRSITARIEKGEGTFGKLFTDEAAYKSFTDTVSSINRFVTQGQKMKVYLGFRSEYLFEPSDTKGYFTLRLNPREDKFYLVEVLNDPRGRRSVTDTVTTVTLDDGSETTVSEHEVETDDKLKFSLEFGKRFADLTLRAGYIESSAGVGADWRFGGDRGRLSLDLFDFNREESNPHLKLSGSYHVYKGVYLTAGVDDLIEDDNRSVFAGAGIIFSDEDIKSVLGLGTSFIK